MSIYRIYNSETVTEVIIVHDQKFTIVEPGFDIYTEKISQEIAQKWAESKAVIDDFVSFLREKGPGLEPIYPGLSRSSMFRNGKAACVDSEEPVLDL